MLSSETGTHQGCPLGPLGFALAIQPVLEELQDKGELIWSSWYLDDGILLGSPEKVSEAFTWLQLKLAERGLVINQQKCEAWGPRVAPFSATHPTVACCEWGPGSGTKVLGCPVNFPQSTDFAEAHWKATCTKLEHTVQRVTQVTDLQMAHHLLRTTLDACKVTHLLRATDCYRSDAGVREADAIILTGFEDLLGQGLPAAQRVQVGLPFASGGCGIRSPLSIRPAARIAALATYHTSGADRIGAPHYARQVSAALVTPVLQELAARLGPNFDPVARWLGSLESISKADREHTQQRWWSDALGKKAVLTLLDQLPPREQARLLEQQNSIGVAFMTTAPSTALHTSISSDQYRLGLKWWLGMPLILEADGPMLCSGCQQTCDHLGDHLLCCRRNNFNNRHAAVQESLSSILTESGQGHTREVRIPNVPDSQCRPADLLLRAWDNGTDTAMDLTICHGWQISEQTTAVKRDRWRQFLCRKEKDKHLKYDALCRQAQWSFRALAFGTWGGVGPEAAKSLHRILKRAAGWQEGDLRAARQEELRQGLGLTLMRHVWRLLESKNFQ